MKPSHRRASVSGKRFAFTLIELLVVVAIISILSGILLPLFIKARDRARKVEAEQAVARPIPPRFTQRSALPSGPAPIIDALKMDMALASSYHRIGMDVFTRYRMTCTGEVAFRHPGGTDENRVLLVIPFPDDILEARDVRIAVRRSGGDAGVVPLSDVVYDDSGIYGTCRIEPGQTLTADIGYTAFGRERFDLTLPPARQIRSVAMTLNLSGTESRILPDDALQPTRIGPERIDWKFTNLVSDRRISILIPGAQAPLARVLLLSRLVALAVLLFGAGFWFLSEQVRPGRLDTFRLGHFLLLALTYSLFFVIFAVLEFDGGLKTPVSMAISAVFSLPLLALHVSRILDLRFAVTRIVPLTLFTLGLVINGVYGGPYRDYIFIAAAIAAMSYVTVSYPAWMAGRERRLVERDSGFRTRRREIAERINDGIGPTMAALGEAQARADVLLRAAPATEELAGARARLQSAREPVEALRKEYDDLTNRLSSLPHRRGESAGDPIGELEQDADALRERVEPQLARLQGEIAAFRDARRSIAEARQEHTPARKGESHCIACGRGIPDAAFCPHCGTAQPEIATCPACGERLTVPVHLLGANRPATALHCPHCGTNLPVPGTRTAQESNTPSTTENTV